MRCDKQGAGRTHGQADGNLVIKMTLDVSDALSGLARIIAGTGLGTVPHMLPAHNHCTGERLLGSDCIS